MRHEIYDLEGIILRPSPRVQDRLQSQVTDSCKQYGGFYLGSVGGAAAVLAEDCIKKVEAPPPCGDKLNPGNRLIEDPWAVPTLWIQRIAIASFDSDDRNLIYYNLTIISFWVNPKNLHQ